MMRKIPKYKITIKFSLTMLAILIMTNAKSQQYFSYSQYMNNLTPVNSAYSLLDKNGSISTLVEKQWLNIPGSPTTIMFNGKIPLESINGATGISVMDNQVAVEHLTEINGFFAKSVKLSENQYLGLSMNVGFRRYVANYSSLDANDPLFVNDVRQNKPNVGFGVMLYSDRYYLGVSMPEFTITSLGTASVESNAYFRNHYNFSAAYLFDLSTGINFKPAALVSYTKGLPVTSDVSGTFYFNKTVGMGLDYRSNSKMAGIMSIGVSNFKFGYSYQFGMGSNNLGGVNFATHEVTLTYSFGKHLNEISIL